MQLTIGYHQLEGKRVALKKPLAILERVGAASAEEEGGAAAAEGEEQAPSAASYRVAGVLRHKVLFKARPRALISKPAARR